MKLNHDCDPHAGRLNDQQARPDFPGPAVGVKRGTQQQCLMKLKFNPARVATGPAPGIGNAPARTSLQPARLTLTAPSIRMPATRANRQSLRALREAELRAWDAASPNASLRAEVQRSLAGSPGEGWLLGGITAMAACALVIGMAAALDFVAHWDRFVSLVRAWIG
jgi:hypothetical protein